MFLTEYNQEKVLEQERRDSERRGERRGERIGEKRGFNKGLNQGLNQGLYQANERIAKDMLMDGKPLGEIIKYSSLAEDVIRGLAEKIGSAIA